MVAPFIRTGVSAGLVAGTLIDANLQRDNGAGVQRGPVNARWLLAADEVGISVRSPHEVRAVQESLNLQATTFGALTDSDWSSMMLGRQPRTISVTAEWRARHNLDDIQGDHDKLVALTKKDARLGRVPLVNFQWAKLRLNGWVSNIMFDWVDGTFDSPPFLAQAFVVRLTVTAAQTRAFETTDRFERFTRQRRIGSGETFESIAFKQYGDPNLGNVLRRNNPGVSLVGEVPGDVVRFYERDHSIIREADPRPQSPALQGNDVRGVLQTMAIERIGVAGPGLEALELELGLS